MRTVLACASVVATTLAVAGCGDVFTAAIPDPDAGPDCGCDDATPPTPDSEAGQDVVSPPPGPDAAPDGMDGGLDASCGPCPDASPDAGGDSGLEGGIDSGLDSGHEGGIDSGLDSGMDSGIDSGLDSGMDSGVSDGGLDAEAGVTCTPGDLSCMGNTQVQCNSMGNAWINALPCMYVCSLANAGLDSGTLCGVCNPNSYQCNGSSRAEACDDNGDWQAPVSLTQCVNSCTSASRFTLSYDNDTLVDSFTTYQWAHRELNGSTVSLATAQAYCTGLGPYRLPSRTELLTLKITGCNINIDNAAFDVDSLVEPVWTEDVSSPGYEWVYEFGTSGVGMTPFSQTLDTAFFVCIHS